MLRSCKAPLFENLVGGSSSPIRKGVGGVGAHYANVRLSDIDFVLRVRLQNKLSIRVDKEKIVVGKII